MKNIDKWKPTKFAYKNEKLLAGLVSPSSYLAVAIIADLYDANIPKYIKGNFLDLGCGNAPLYGKYKNYAREVTCVDWKNSLHSNNYLDIESDLNKPLELESDKFDSVILSDVLEHIAKPEQLLSEIERILNKGGYLLLNVPYFYWIHEHPHDYHRYTEFALKRLLEVVNLELIYIEPTGGSLEILSDFIGKHLIKLPIFGYAFTYLLSRISYLFFKSRAGKVICKRSAVNFPFGYFLVAQKQ